MQVVCFKHMKDIHLNGYRMDPDCPACALLTRAVDLFTQTASTTADIFQGVGGYTDEAMAELHELGVEDPICYSPWAFADDMRQVAIIGDRSVIADLAESQALAPPPAVFAQKADQERCARGVTSVGVNGKGVVAVTGLPGLGLFGGEQKLPNA